MKLIERGAGSPRVAVVGGIHGDEPAGERIVSRLIDTLKVSHGTAQLLLANERALATGTRFTDTDLNRSFPGDPRSEEYEPALAARLLDVLDGADAILALHTSQSAPPPFAIYSHVTESVRRTVTGLPVDYVVDAGDLRTTTLDSTLPHTVSFETGRQQSEEAAEFGYKATKAFLRAHGVLTDAEPTHTTTQVVRAREEVPKGGGEPHLNYSNFEEITPGSVFAYDDVHTHRVKDEGLVPVLASEDGYEDIFGIYGTFEDVIEPVPDDG